MAPKIVMLASTTALPHHGYGQPQQRIGEKNQRSYLRGSFLMSSLHVSFILMLWFLPGNTCHLKHRYFVFDVYLQDPTLFGKRVNHEMFTLQ